MKAKYKNSQTVFYDIDIESKIDVRERFRRENITERFQSCEDSFSWHIDVMKNNGTLFRWFPELFVIVFGNLKKKTYPSLKSYSTYYCFFILICNFLHVCCHQFRIAYVLHGLVRFLSIVLLIGGFDILCH